MNLMDKYTSKTLNEVILDDKTLDPIITFANSWMQGFPNTTRPALFLHGKQGTGKTMTVRALCNDCEWSIIELNASSIRTAEQLQSLFKIPSYDFFGRRICLFLDESDSIDGGEAIIKKIIMRMKFPVIMAANDQYKVPKVLRDVSEPIQFWSPKAKNLKQYLLKINKEEGLCLPIEIIDNAAESCDYRLAFNALESKQILSAKEKKMSVIDCTKNLMYNQEAKFEDTRSLLYYLDENAPKVYDVLDLQELFEIMYKADKYNRRNKVSFANSIIKEIPKVTTEIEEIKRPIYYEKNKNKAETTYDKV